MKKILSLFMCFGLVLGLIACDNSSKENNDDPKENPIEEKKVKTLDDYPNIKVNSNAIVDELNGKIDDDYSFSEIKYDDDWIHVVFSNSTPVTFELDFKSNNDFVGITIDNNSFDTVNDSFRSLPMAVLSLSIFNINDDEMNGAIDLLTNLDSDSFEGNSVSIMDNKTLNIFSITIK